MRLTLEEKNDTKKTVLDDNAMIYSKREEKTARERLKELKGVEKISYFCTYFLWKYVVGLLIAGLVFSLVYTMFIRVTPEDKITCYVINSPFAPGVVEQVKSEISELLVTDAEKEQVSIDDNYYFWSNDYNYRMVFVAHVAGGDVDMLILDRNEFYNQVNNEILMPVKDAISPELYEKLADKYELAAPKTTNVDGVEEIGEEDVYGLNIESFLERVNGEYGAFSDYCVGFVVNSSKKENFDTVVRYMFE